MTDKKDGKPMTGGGKKPTPIIDLTATVVETSKPSVETRAAFAEPRRTAAAPASAGPSASATATPAASSAPAGAKAASEAAAPRGTTSSVPPASASPAGAPIQPVPRTRGGFASHLLSGIVGGALALLGATQAGPMLGLNFGGGAGDARIADLEQKLSRLTAAGDLAQKATAAEARLGKLEQGVQGLTSEQAKIAADLKGVADKAAKAGADLPPGAAEKLIKLEEQLAQMVAAARENPQTAGRLPQLAQLTGKIGEVETQVATRTAQLRTDLLQQMDQRFAKSGETLETTRSTLSQRTQSIEQSLKAVTDETASLRAGMDSVKLDLDRRFAAAAKPADVQSAVAGVAAKVSSLESNMQNVVKSEQERNATAGNILLSLELANLKRALDRGGKYASELAAVRKLAGDKLDLAVLEAQQTTGVPSLEALGKELAQNAHAMLDAEAEPANATVGERLLSGVKSIVRVRRVDFAPTDTTTEAVIARMELALKEGRIADTLEESKKLSAKAAAAGAKWLDRIKSRAAVDAALAALDQSLKSSLAGGAAPKKVSN